MRFIRPEIWEAMVRFRDAIAGVAVSLVGLYLALANIGPVAIIGTSMAVAGALLVFAGIQRGRFRTGAGGTGVVMIDEGQVTYFGPLEGGTIIIADLAKVELDTNEASTSDWVLYEPSTNPLRIPTDAEGAEALFDVFSGLEGLKTEQMLTALENSQHQQVVIWQANHARLH